MTKVFGDKGEELAKDFLIKKGFEIIAKNWYFGKEEIDIIGKIADYIVFIEVKTRSTDFFGKPYTFVTKTKQKKILKAANQFIFQNNVDLEARFDIVSIVTSNNKLEIDHIENAFFPTI